MEPLQAIEWRSGYNFFYSWFLKITRHTLNAKNQPLMLNKAWRAPTNCVKEWISVTIPPMVPSNKLLPLWKTNV